MLFLCPKRAVTFNFLDEIGDGEGSREGGKKMDMVFRPADTDGQAAEVFRAASEKGVKLPTESGFL